MSKDIEIVSGLTSLGISSILPNPIASAIVDKVVNPILTDFISRMLSTRHKTGLREYMLMPLKDSFHLRKGDIPLMFCGVTKN